MKNSIKYIVFLLLATVAGGCNNEVDDPLPPCDPDVIGQDVKFYSTRTGALIFTDTVPNFILPNSSYFIISVDSSYSTLTPCNIPETGYNLSIGDTLAVLFSGNLMVLSPTVSSNSSIFELTSIQKSNTNE